MANPYWIGSASPVAQISTLTVGGVWVAAQVYTINCGYKVLTVIAGLAGDTDNDTLTAIIFAALNNEPDLEYKDATYSYPGTGSVITATASIPGVPFVFTTSATGTGAFVTATPTASSGPEHYDTAINWSTAAVPVSTDTVTFPAGSPPCRYGILQSGVTPAAVYIYSETVGLPERRGGQPTGYAEYRTRDLTYAGGGLFNVGDPVTALTKLVGLATVGGAAGVYTVDTGVVGAQQVGAVPAVRITTGVGAAHSLRHVSGSLGVADRPGQVARFDTLLIGTDGPPSSRGTLDAKPTLTIGSGFVGTSTTGTIYDGDVSCRAAIATIGIRGQRQQSATWLQRDAAITTLTLTGGTIWYNAAANITTLSISGMESVFDASGANGAFTVTTCTVTGGAKFWDSEKRITSLSLTIDRASLKFADFGDTMTLSRA